MMGGKRKIIEGVKLFNQKSIGILGEKEIYKYLEKSEADTITDERKKDYLEEKISFWNRAQQQKSYQRE